jgi:deoxyadenosine/deoxycytidine kinase
MTKKFILVSGNIGAGKTTITKRLGERMGWETGFESVSDNPYLADFYQDMAKWGFHLQMFFLGNRADQHKEANESPKSVILDRSIYEDFHIFARALRQLGSMNERDYHSYQALYNKIVESLPVPDLLIHLEAPIDVLRERISMRGREIEEGISKEYLGLLDSFYQEWLELYDYSKVLRVESNQLNFAESSEDLEKVIEKINQTLSGQEKIILSN